MNRLYIIIGVVVVALLAACKPKTPRQFIQPDEMEDILVDYHLAMAMAEENNQYGYDQQYYLESALRKHGVTQAEFDSSMVFYYTRADRFEAIYKHVSERLEERALALGATEGEIGKYAALNANGDTANIWAERSMMVLRPMPPYNRIDFSIEPDSTFRRGDNFLMQFMLDYVYQDGKKDGLLYLAVDYPDTTVVRQSRFSYSGLSQLRIEGNDTADVQRIRGFFYLGGAYEQSTTLRLLFMNNIQLIRFHKQQNDETKQIPQDSIPRDTVARRAEPDTVGRRDSIGASEKILSVSRGVISNRMGIRDNRAKERR